MRSTLTKLGVARRVAELVIRREWLGSRGVETLPRARRSGVRRPCRCSGPGSVVVRRCRACDTVQWPPRPTCGTCHQTAFASHPVDPVGTVHTFSVVHRAFHPWFADRLPYGVAVVDVSGGSA
ncbi:Zn-ribbon domain-containing OB-fold protein [Nocardioides alcanivorans]|uniref:Zn-ribbon domain-containing OB-fold protein n=1 Tax=Nocardioides alcanivorans TaxID=2897352 RepID=UPI0035DD04AD